MRSILLILISFFCLNLGNATASALPSRAILLRRDDPSASSSDSPAPSSSGDNKFPALTTTTAQAATSAIAPSSQPVSSGASAAMASVASKTALPSASGTVSASPTASVDPASDEAPLPIQPQLTAALAVAGVILLVSGIICTFVGIKSRSVQVFISTAYLIGLGITVLIVYVMTPPVSAGTQGAYVAAIVLPALVLGAGACVFKDITEGLGCAVGGFALGMWFLTVKPGGLIDSQAGKIILLCCFTGIAFSFSFSRYTRTYGIIGATAFAGATAIILGIDCFALTGYKEFWLYIWALNNNLFPLGTHTYPLTKNLKAEIAGIPILTLFGVLSQIKVWQIVQKKRAERAEAEEQKAREKEDEEARLGKDLEARNQAEKMIWERTYADAPRDIHSDSGIGSEPSNSEKGTSEKGSARNSVSERGKAEETIKVTEMHDVTSAQQSKAAKRLTPHIIVSVAEEADEDEDTLKSPRSPSATSPKLPPLNFGYGHDPAEMDEAEDETTVAAPERTIDPGMMESLKGKSLKPKTIPTPVVIPLPFSVPSGPTTPKDDDASSVATAATSVKRMSKRWSTNSLFEKMTKGKLSRHAREASDATSVQAVADSPTRDHFDTVSIIASRKTSIDATREKTVSTPGSKPSSPGSKQASPLAPEHEIKTEAEPSSPRGDYFSSKAPAPVPTDNGLLSPTLARSPGAEAQQSSEYASARDQATESEKLQTIAQPVVNLDSIKASSSGTSKVMNAFRTNEWAKHLEGANYPEEDNIPMSEPPSPTYPPPAVVEEAKEQEEDHTEATRYSASQSQESSVSPSPTSVTPTPVEDAAPKASWPKPSSRRRTSSTEPKAIVAPTRQASRDRTSSRMSALRSSSGSRTRGGMVRQPQQALVASPIHEDVEAFFPPQQVKRRSSHDIRPDSLLAQREAMVSQSSIVRSNSQASNYPSGTGHNGSRNSLAHGQTRPVSQLSRRSSNPEQFHLPQRQPSAASLRGADQPYSPPAPIRTYSPMTVAPPIMHASATPSPDRPSHYKNSAPDESRRSDMLAQWRASLAGDHSQRRASRMDADVEAARVGQGWLDSQRQQREYERSRHQAVGWGTERTMSPTTVNHNTMQNQAAAHDAHREILRRMQSNSKVQK